MHPSSKKAKVAHNPSSASKKAKKDATALAVFDPKKPFFVYEIFRPDLDNKTVYVGRTDDVKRRSGQHVMASSPCKLVNELRKLLNVKTFRDIIKLVPELPEGVPASRIVEMEAYFIMERRTVYHARDNEYGCNAKNGDKVHEITPTRYNEIEAELSSGFEWPVDSGVRNDVPVEVVKARGLEVVFKGIVQEAEETGEDEEFVQALRGDMALVTGEREAMERLLLSARMAAGELAYKYRVAGLDAIDREQFTKELNMLKDKIDVDGEDEVINGIINGVLLAAKPQREVRMSSDAASGFVTGIAKMLTTREEERLVWTNDDVKRRMYEVRAWSRRNDMKKPIHKHHEADQHSLAKFLDDWMGQRLDIDQASVVMRNVPWFTMLFLAGPVPFKWRLDWFTPDHYIRFYMKDKYVDTGDVFGVACASASAAKAANSAYLGAGSKLNNTAARNEFSPSVLRTIRWNGTRGDRKILPICAMQSIVKRMTTETAKMLVPEFTKLVDDIQNDRFVHEPVEETAIVLSTGSTTLATTESTATTTTPPGTMVSRGSTFVVQSNPLPPTCMPVPLQLERFKAITEIETLRRKELHERNEFQRHEELAQVEQAAKKRKIELHNFDTTAKLEELKFDLIVKLKKKAAEEGVAGFDGIVNEFVENIKRITVTKDD